MKTFTKIFMAVVVLFAFACTTDTTFDQTVELGAGQTTITLSLDEESRTHITGKNGDEYPLYWSEGDKIAVNGKTSNALGEASHGQTTATFTVEGDLGYPRNIVYPAPAEGVTAATAGNYPVTFMASQPYTANTFAEGSTPMYAYVSENANVNLQHLAGVLRFDVKGNGEVLKALVVEVEKGKISGNFDVDCANGTLTPHADATNTVTVTFPENGLTLTTAATPIYVAVPKGEYGVVTLTLYTSDGKMMKGCFDASTKPIMAGKIREFQEFVVSDYSQVEEGVFIIYDEATLREFASRVNAAEENFDITYPTAKVVANINLTKPWASINGYTGTFDGCNRTISNLDAPLFEVTSATIKGVHLKDVAINKSLTTPLNFAALVGHYSGASISNCSAGGSMTVVCDITENNISRFGGLIGYVDEETALEELTNNIDFTVAGSFPGKDNSIFVGGVLAGIDAQVTAKKFTNNGHITIGDATASDRTSVEVGKNINLGGVIGFVNVASICEEMSNNGSLSIVKTTADNNISLGGVIGYNFKAVTANGTWSNNGALNISGATISTGQYGINVGGLLGYKVGKVVVNDTWTNTNNGSIDITDITIPDALALNCGGVVGLVLTNAMEIHGAMTNNAAINVTGESSKSINALGYLNLGGVVGCVDATVTATDNITNEGGITIYASATNGIYTKFVTVGGVMGKIADPVNSTADLTNRGDITIQGTKTEYVYSSRHMHIGGVLGGNIANVAKNTDEEIPLTLTSLNNLTNEGDITLINTVLNARMKVGGIVGGSITPQANSMKSYCNISAKGFTNVGMASGRAYSSETPLANCLVGGSIWKDKNASSGTDLTLANYPAHIYGSGVTVEDPANDVEKAVVNNNKCGWLSENINSPVQYKTLPGVKIGSKADFLVWADTAAGSSESVALTANIDMTGEEWTSIEGFAGTLDGGNFKIIGLKAPLFGTTQASIKNLTLENVNITTSGSAVGALACCIDNSNAYVQNCSVTGSVTVNNETAPATFAVSGITGRTFYGSMIGVSTSTQIFSNLTTDVAFTLSGKCAKFEAANCIADHRNGGLQDVTTLGSFTYTGENKETNYISGIVSYCFGGMTNCVNGKEGDPTKGTITTNTPSSGQSIIVAGVISYCGGEIEDCVNHGNVNIQGENARLMFGGVAYRAIGDYTAVFTNCANKGSLIVDATCKNSSQVICGGLATINGETGSNTTFSNCHNSGSIEFTKNSSFEAALHFGGLLGESDTNAPITFNGCSNNGSLKYNASMATNVRIGGLAAYLKKPVTFSDCENKGVVTVDGTLSGTLYTGGIVGHAKNVSVVEGTVEKPIKNSGAVTVEHTTKATTVYVGGVVGFSESTTINCARCCCTITAWSYTNVGMIMGNAYAETTKATNCHIGGTIDQGAYGEYTDDDGVEVNGWHSKPLPIRADVYYKAIYSNRDIDAAIAVDNGCGYISAIDAEPVYAEVE